MAKEVLRIGMLHPVAAPIKTETEGQPIEYGAGMAVGNAVAATISWNRADTSHYGDDAEDARDNGITSGDISFTNSGILQEVRTVLLGEEVQGTTNEYEISSDATPPVGFGYIRVLRKNGAIGYEGVWLHKVQFAEDSIEDSTKGESIEWGETILNGRIMGVKNNSQMKTRYMAHKEFTTLEDADAWLRSKANITATPTETTTTGGGSDDNG